MLLSELDKTSNIKRNYLLIEYTFVDKGVQVIAKDMVKGREPQIKGRTIIAVGPDVHPSTKVGDEVIFDQNNLEYNSNSVMFDDNEFDRKKVVDFVMKLKRDGAKWEFEDFVIKAHVLVPESVVLMTFTKEPLDKSKYANTRSNLILN